MSTQAIGVRATKNSQIVEDEKLISLVEAHRELYDKTSSNYKLCERKKLVWEYIATEMQSSVEICMRRWSALRDRYGREIRKSVAPSSSGATYCKPWHFLEAMQFLKTHVVPRPLRCSQSAYAVPLSSPSPPTAVEEPSPSSPLLVAMHSPSPSSPIISTMPSLSSTPSTSVFSPSSSPSPSPVPSTSAPLTQQAKGRKRSGTSTDVDKSMLEAINMFKKRCAEREEEYRNPAVYNFGKMIISMLSEMSAEKQSKAMLRIMEVAVEIKKEPEALEIKKEI